MIELFQDIPEFIRVQTKFWVEKALREKDPVRAVQIVKEYRDSCFNDRQREFVDFYFNLELMKLKEGENK